MPEDDVEVIHMSAADWNRALQNSLDDIGITWRDLVDMAEAQDFVSLRAQQLWLMAGHQGFIEGAHDE